MVANPTGRSSPSAAPALGWNGGGPAARLRIAVGPVQHHARLSADSMTREVRSPCQAQVDVQPFDRTTGG